MKNLKKVMIIFLLGLVMFFSCEIPPIEEPFDITDYTTDIPETELAPFVSFESVSQPYLNIYGAPEEISTFTSGSDYTMIDWWWWSKGFEVTFANTTYDDVNGWCVDSTYTFDPMLTDNTY